MKKHRLTLGESEEMTALAIVAAEKDYRICFHINKALHIDLALEGSLGIEIPARGLISIPAYQFSDITSHCDYLLVKNRQPDFYVVPQLRQADFIFIINPAREAAELESFKKALSSVSNIQSTFVVSGAHLKHIHIGE